MGNVQRSSSGCCCVISKSHPSTTSLRSRKTSKLVERKLLAKNRKRNAEWPSSYTSALPIRYHKKINANKRRSRISVNLHKLDRLREENDKTRRDCRFLQRCPFVLVDIICFCIRLVLDLRRCIRPCWRL